VGVCLGTAVSYQPSGKAKDLLNARFDGLFELLAEAFQLLLQFCDFST
jgi:hypothetical protein